MVYIPVLYPPILHPVLHPPIHHPAPPASMKGTLSGVRVLGVESDGLLEYPRERRIILELGDLLEK